VYKDGRVCISILHSAGDDPHGYERASERWSPVHTARRMLGLSAWQTALSLLGQADSRMAAAKQCPLLLQVETIMISIISMLSSPNDESPANIDAAKEWRENREGFKRHVARIVRKSQEML